MDAQKYEAHLQELEKELREVTQVREKKYQGEEYKKYADAIKGYPAQKGPDASDVLPTMPPPNTYFQPSRTSGKSYASAGFDPTPYLVDDENDQIVDGKDIDWKDLI